LLSAWAVEERKLQAHSLWRERDFDPYASSDVENAARVRRVGGSKEQCVGLGYDSCCGKAPACRAHRVGVGVGHAPPDLGKRSPTPIFVRFRDPILHPIFVRLFFDFASEIRASNFASDFRPIFFWCDYSTKKNWTVFGLKIGTVF
jgi:hypothetical protein